MFVRSAKKAVSDTLLRRRVVLLHALPGAGRTSLLQALSQDAPEDYVLISGNDFLCWQAQAIQETCAGKTICVDAISANQVGAIDQIIRSCQDSGRSSVKFVLVGRDAKTEQELSSALLGRIENVELPPVQILEHFEASRLLQTAKSLEHDEAPQALSTNLPSWNMAPLWSRGGLPDSINASSDADSFAWRKRYLRDLLSQDFGCWGIDASDRLPEVFQIIANRNGAEFDEAKCANILSLKKESVRRSINLLVRMGMVRHLPNWPAGSDRSLKNMPAFYIRDCGLLHSMVGLGTLQELRESPAYGKSWESFTIEAIINAAPEGVTPAFFRKEKNEIDLILSFSNNDVHAIELKTSASKKPEAGFFIACEEIGVTEQMVIHTEESDVINDGEVPRLSLLSAVRRMHSRR